LISPRNPPRCIKLRQHMCNLKCILCTWTINNNNIVLLSYIYCSLILSLNVVIIIFDILHDHKKKRQKKGDERIVLRKKTRSSYGKKELIDFIYVIIKEVNMEKEKKMNYSHQIKFSLFFWDKKLWFDSIWLLFFFNF